MDPGLKITAVDQRNESTSSAIVNKTEIVAQSKGFIDNEEGLYSLISEAITNSSEKLDVFLDGKSFILSILIEYPLKKKITVAVALKEEAQDPLERLQKLIQRQTGKIEELKKKLETSFPYFDKSKLKKVSPIIDTTGTFSSYFQISENKKSAIRNPNQYNNGQFYHLSAEDSFHADYSPEYFEVNITSRNNPKAPTIMVGVSTSVPKASGDANIYNNAGVYLLNCQSGAILRSGETRDTGLFCASDSIIRIYYDFQNKIISFETGGNIYNVELLKQHQDKAFYPIFMANSNDSVEFL